jgi:hypothetical protein
MDYPLKRRRSIWKDSLYLRLTIDALTACGIVMVVLPLVLVAFQFAVAIPPQLRVSIRDVLKTTGQFVFLWGFPYTWLSFLSIEKIQMRFGSHRDFRLDSQA